MKSPVIKIKDDTEFSKTHVEVSVRFDWDWSDPGKSRDVVVTFMLERGDQSLAQLRNVAVARAREVLQEAIKQSST